MMKETCTPFEQSFFLFSSVDVAQACICSYLQ